MSQAHKAVTTIQGYPQDGVALYTHGRGTALATMSSVAVGSAAATLWVGVLVMEAD